ncbi:MAG: prepilin-type N-terminal cleavage/methylation domain-containing protein [Ramlibacter sp.]|nr:prepilin-type N-terminal cleavage/methylation domain-containing protein [Ramlibacter sp.]
MRIRRRNRGFTLVELLVALFAMALLAVMSWRGLDGMTRAQASTAARADEVLSLQVGLAQWSADLDAIVDMTPAPALDWNGRVLRLTRRDSINPASGVLVVAWTQRGGQWLRWQAPPVTTRGELSRAWERADQWSQTPGDAERRLEVAVTPLQEWQIFYYRSDAWTNPLSSDAVTQLIATPELKDPGRDMLKQNLNQSIPDGVRLVLLLPPGQALAGRIVRDWVRPTHDGKS